MASALELTIELQQGGETPTGRLHAVAGPPVEFAGWLQLLDALRTAIDAAAERGWPA